jgi:4-hydroxy-tetrahydrodipicolinate synthase
MMKIGRLITAMITPFDERGEVDYAQAKKLAKALIASGSDGVVVVGTTGESPTITWEEEYRLFKEIKEAIGDKGAVIAGTGSNNTAEAVEATREAEKIGVDAALLVVPYYNKPPQEGLYQHFKAIAESTSLPCILYNVPSRTITSLSAETCIKLSKIPNIIGVKEASANFTEIARIIGGTRKDFYVWSGNDSDTFSMLALGGYGVISVASHLVGLQIKKMIDTFVAGKTGEAAAMHRDLIPIFDILFCMANPIPVKYALNQVGFRAGKCRLPLVEPDTKTGEAIMKVVNTYRIDLPVKK